MPKYLDKSLTEINELLKEHKITPTDLVEEAFANIEEHQDLNCFITLDKEGALKRAKELSDEVRTHKRSTVEERFSHDTF